MIDRPGRWLPLAALAVAALALGQVPVVDEESYLDIAGQLLADPARPYDWWRPWQPWGAARTADAYLYAHPPLHLWWVGLWSQLFGADQLAWIRAGAALPFALMLGRAAGAIAAGGGAGARPGLAAALWLAGPVTILGLHAGLMIDLGMVALSTAAVARWLRRPDVAAGILLGLACGWKYPALVLAPLLAWDAWRRGLRPWGALVGFLAVWGGLEAFLALQYGRAHLLEVLSTAPELGRGPLAGRAFGALTRLGLALGPALIAARPRAAGIGLLVAAPGALTWGEGPAGIGLLLVLGAAGWAGLTILAGGLGADPRRRLLGAWGLAVVAAVILGHNYAGGRYLWPAILPLGVLTARELGLRRGPIWRAAIPAGVALWGILGLSLSWSQARQSRAAVELAEKVIAEHPRGRFTGEWAWRWRMRRAGWTFWSPGEPLAAGDVLAAPLHAGPGPIPEGLEPAATYAAEDALPLRLLDLEAGVGYHAETLGALPMGWRAAPLEEARVYEVGERGSPDRGAPRR